MQLEKTQPLIVQETTNTAYYPTIQEAPIAVGQVYFAQNQNNLQNNPNNMYNPPNNGYQGQPPNMGRPNQVFMQGPPPPLVQQAMPIQIMNHPQIIFIQQQLMVGCPACGFMGSYPRRTAGCQLFAWCICLFIFTGFLCFWIPFCIDSCYDVEIVCSRCGLIKTVIES